LNLNKRLDLSVRAITLCLVAQVLLSWKLWIASSRSFPTIPFFDFLDIPLVSTIEYFMFGTLLLGLIALAILPSKKQIALIVLIVSGLLILQDITRLQVWFYQLIFLIWVLYFRNETNKKIVLNSIQISICLVYFWSGVNKLNVYFIEDTFPWFFGKTPFLQSFAESQLIAISVALFELFLGIILLIRRTRLIGIYLVALFHLIILLFLGPLVHNWNEVVWPWNILMIVLVILLFKNEESQLFKKYQFKQFYPLLGMLLLFGLMPFFNIFKKWDDQLSFKMYSGTNPEGTLYFSIKDDVCFDPSIQSIILGYQTRRVVIDDWALHEMKVAPYTNSRTVKHVAKKLCECFENTEIGGLEYLEVYRWSKAKEQTVQIPCKDLLKNKQTQL